MQNYPRHLWRRRSPLLSLTALPANAAVPTADQQVGPRSSSSSARSRSRWTTQTYSGAVNRTMPDTALLGNGDIGVTSGGRARDSKTFHISKGDFWTSAGSPPPWWPSAT